jgi:hypothetical protein
MKLLSLSLSALLIAVGITSAAPSRFQEDAAPTQEASDKPASQEEAQEEAAEPEAPKIQDDDVALYAGLSLEEAKAKVELLIAGFEEQMAEYRKKFQEASAEDKVKLRSQAPKPADFVDNLQKLAELHPATDVSLQALAWIVQRTRTGEAYEAALDTLVANHADAEVLKPVILGLQYQIASPRISEIFDQLLARCMDSNQLGVVHYARLQYGRRVEDVKRALVDDPETAKRFSDDFGQERIDYINNFTTLSEEDLLGAMEKLSAEYGDVKLSETKTIAQALEGDMFEIKFLQVGKEAPDIEGEDIDGVAFKLSDYRGKVILLDFWGDW